PESPSSKKTRSEAPLTSAIVDSPLVFRKLLSAYAPSPVTYWVTSARYAWLLAKLQLLSEANPMLVPVTAFPANVTELFAPAALEFVGPCQYSIASFTVPVTPLTVTVPVPSPRMPPKPAD